MSEEITMSALIDKVKTDLFAEYAGTENEGLVAYPIFFVDQVELELTVDITYDANAGIKVTIPQVIGAEMSGGRKSGTGHTMKLNLSPILTREEQRALMFRDKRLWKGVEDATAFALRRGPKLAGAD